MEIEAQLESLDTKIEKYNKKTDKLSRLVTSLATSVEQNSSQEELKELVGEIKKDYSKNQKGLNKKITELKTAITKANDTIETFSQNSVENIDINKLYNMFDEFKTNTDLSNQTVNTSIEKIETMLTEYNQNLRTINLTSTDGENIKDAVKSLNDEFYVELLQLFNSLSFEGEAEDLKEFMEDILASVALKTNENTEKLNSIMLQFKNLLNKIEGIEKTQNSISDYLKPEDADDLVYSFDDIQADLAKMRLVLNDISNTQDVVGEISGKIEETREQIENISKLLGTSSDTEEGSFAINKQIEDLNARVYDISMRTNKLLLTNEDSTIELKNNLELFKEVCDKANPEKIYELFYELTHYFNDVTAKMEDVTAITRASHNEAVTIKNALVYVGEWLDNATGVLEEMRTGIQEIAVREQVVAQSEPPVVDLSALQQPLEENFAAIYARINTLETDMQKRLDDIDAKIENLLNVVVESKESSVKAMNPFMRNIDKRFTAIEEVLEHLSKNISQE